MTTRAVAPLAKSPMWRVDGTAQEIVLPDGRVADRKERALLCTWPSLKLFVVVERYPFESPEDRQPRVAAARALVDTLAKAANWKRLESSAGATAFGRSLFSGLAKKVVLQRFNANTPGPKVLARTGGTDDVQYEWSLILTDLCLYLYAHDTPKNRATMGKLFDAVRRSREGAVWATLGHGHAGLFSAERNRSGDMRKLWALDGRLSTGLWRAHIGSTWTVVPSAKTLVERWAAKHESQATLDSYGLEAHGPVPKSVSEKAPELVALARSFHRLRLAAGKEVNRAFHDKRQRKALGL